MSVVPPDFTGALLWVIPRDLLLDDAGALVVRSSNLGFEALTLEGGYSLAINVHSPCTRHGRPVDYQHFLSESFKLRPVEASLKKCEWVENANLPACKFWPRIWLSAKEANSVYTMSMRSSFSAGDRIKLRFLRRLAANKTDEEELRSVVVPWFSTAVHRGFSGEFLADSKIDFIPYAETGSAGPSHFGFDLTFEYEEPVSWPWLELFLRIRSAFPIRQRFSLEFHNLSNSSANAGELAAAGQR